MKNKTELMKEIEDKIVALKNSPLISLRKENNYLPVIGEGSYDANIVFVGEAPGKNEAITGRPFCGRAGKILDQLLEGINLDRKKIYITNIVKDRPPENRDPSPEEIAIYAPFLDRQIDIIKPKVVVTLGRFSMSYLLNFYQNSEADKSISQLHGQVIPIKASFGDFFIIPLYHPAATIYNQSLREVLKSDFEVLKKI